MHQNIWIVPAPLGEGPQIMLSPPFVWANMDLIFFIDPLGST